MVQRDRDLGDPGAEDPGDNWQDSTSPWDDGHETPRRRFGARARAPRTRLNQALTVASGAPHSTIDPWDDAEEVTDQPIEPGPARYRAEPETPTAIEPRPSQWGAARRDNFGPAMASSRALATGEEPIHLVVDLRSKAVPATTGDAATNYGLGKTWGSQWRDAAQGWVPDRYGAAVWRPVVATTEDLAIWDVRTYLGIVTAEVAVEAHGGDFRQLGATLTRAREMGVNGLVDEAIARGAHAVVGVDMTYTPVGGRLLVTITGTAVTLKEKGT